MASGTAGGSITSGRRRRDFIIIIIIASGTSHSAESVLPLGVCLAFCSILLCSTGLHDVVDVGRMQLSCLRTVVAACQSHARCRPKVAHLREQLRV